MVRISEWREHTSIGDYNTFCAELTAAIQLVRNNFDDGQGGCLLPSNEVAQLAFQQLIEMYPPTITALDTDILSKIPTYKADENEKYCAESFLKDVNSILPWEHGVSDEQKCRYLLAKIQNDCLDFKATHNGIANYQQLCADFLATYGTPEKVIIQRLQNLKMFPDKSLQQYNTQFSALVSRLTTVIPVSTLGLWYTDGLDRKLQFEVATTTSQCTTVQAIMQRAEEIEHAQQRYRNYQGKNDNKQDDKKPQQKGAKEQQQRQPQAVVAAVKTDDLPQQQQQQPPSKFFGQSSRHFHRVKGDYFAQLQNKYEVLQKVDSNSASKMSKQALNSQNLALQSVNSAYKQKCLETVLQLCQIKQDLQQRDSNEALKSFAKQIKQLSTDQECQKDIKNVFSTALKNILPVPQIAQLPRDEGEQLLNRLPGGWSLYVRLLFDSTLCEQIKRACEQQEERRRELIKRIVQLQDVEEGEIMQRNQQAVTSLSSYVPPADLRNLTPVKSFGYYVEACINNDAVINALIDSGSTTSSITLPLAQKLNNSKIEPYDAYYTNCNGQKFKYEGVIRPFELSISTPCLNITLPAMPVMGAAKGNYNMLIGLDVLGGSTNQLQVIGHNTQYKVMTVYDTYNSECHVVEYKCNESLRPKHRDVVHLSEVDSDDDDCTYNEVSRLQGGSCCGIDSSCVQRQKSDIINYWDLHDVPVFKLMQQDNCTFCDEFLHISKSNYFASSYNGRYKICLDQNIYQLTEQQSKFQQVAEYQSKYTQLQQQQQPINSSTHQNKLLTDCKLCKLVSEGNFEGFKQFINQYQIIGDAEILWIKAQQLIQCSWEVPVEFKEQQAFYQFIFSLELAYGIKDLGYFVQQPFYFELQQDIKPIILKPYKYFGVKQEFIELQIDLMLEHDIIEKVEYTTWAFPVVIVSKPHLTPEQRNILPLEKVWRFCVDFRMLNQATKMDGYALPTCKEILTSLNGAKYFVKLDLQSGYWQIAVSQEVSECLTFTTQRGTYRYKRMPFGPKTAPLWFQRCMDNLLRDRIGKDVYVYLDDVIIYGNTIMDVLKSAKQVIDLLNSVGLKCNGPKCCFLSTSVYLLGHYVTNSTIYPDCERLMKLTSLSCPKTRKELQSLYGLLNYYRDFIFNFAQKTDCIIQLIRGKQQTVQWTEQQQQALQQVLNELSQSVGLYAPNFSQEFILTTDYSGWGIAAVLSQVNDQGVEVPIQFASRKCNVAESKYPSVEGEALAIMYGLDKFSLYLVGRIFLLRTDAKALVHVSTMTGDNAKLTRWYLKMQQYQFRIQHIKGALNIPSDVFSRLTNRTESVFEEYFDISYFDLLSNQQAHVVQAVEMFSSSSSSVSFSSSSQSISSSSGVEDFVICHYCGKLGAPKMLCLECELKVKQYNLKDITLDINLFGRLITKLYDYTLSIQENQRIDKLVQKIQYTDGQYQYQDVDSVRIIPKYHIRDSLIMDLHKQLRHVGISNLYQTMKLDYYWEGMAQQITQVLASCFECQCERAKDIPHSQLHPIDKQNVPFEGWAIDLIPMSLTGAHNEKFVIVCIDCFSKWPEIGALRNKNSDSTSQWFQQNIISRYGLPYYIRCDNGLEWKGSFSNQLQSYGIQQIFTTPYYPQSNGQVERYVGVIKNAVRRYISSSGSCWTEALPAIGQGLRFCVTRATGHSPFELVTGLRPRLPSSFTLSGPSPPQLESLTESGLLSLTTRLEQLRLEARDKNARLDAYNAAKYQSQLEKTQILLHQGDFVLIKNRLQSKLDSPFIGPCVFLGYNEGMFSAKVKRPDGAIVTVSSTQIVKCQEQLGVKYNYATMFQQYPGPRRYKRRRAT